MIYTKVYGILHGMNAFMKQNSTGATKFHARFLCGCMHLYIWGKFDPRNYQNSSYI